MKMSIAARRGQSARKTAPDSALEDRALNGDRVAWDALVRRHNHSVVVSLIAAGERLDVAQEIAQDTWLLLFEKQRAGRLKKLALPGLAIRQARYLAGDRRRLAANARPHLPISLTPEVERSIDPSARLRSRQLLATARSVVASQGRSAREVFRLAYGVERLGHADIARRLGLSTQRVRQILCELRHLIRERAEESR